MPTWFVGIKQSLELLPNIATTQEFRAIAYRDFFYWGQLDRTFPGKDNPFVGVYWEVVNQSVTTLQVGPHFGTDHFELDLLLGEKESNIRFAYTVPL
ncbi:MAG: hypothetical protein AAB515_00340 [Patescibacteria group bacterium]